MFDSNSILLSDTYDNQMSSVSPEIRRENSMKYSSFIGEELVKYLLPLAKLQSSFVDVNLNTKYEPTSISVFKSNKGNIAYNKYGAAAWLNRFMVEGYPLTISNAFKINESNRIHVESLSTLYVAYTNAVSKNERITKDNAEETLTDFEQHLLGFPVLKDLAPASTKNRIPFLAASSKSAIDLVDFENKIAELVNLRIYKIGENHYTAKEVAKLYNLNVPAFNHLQADLIKYAVLVENLKFSTHKISKNLSGYLYESLNEKLNDLFNRLSYKGRPLFEKTVDQEMLDLSVPLPIENFRDNFIQKSLLISSFDRLKKGINKDIVSYSDVTKRPSVGYDPAIDTYYELKIEEIGASIPTARVVIGYGSKLYKIVNRTIGKISATNKVAVTSYYQVINSNIKTNIHYNEESELLKGDKIIVQHNKPRFAFLQMDKIEGSDNTTYKVKLTKAEFEKFGSTETRDEVSGKVVIVPNIKADTEVYLHYKGDHIGETLESFKITKIESKKEQHSIVIPGESSKEGKPNTLEAERDVYELTVEPVGMVESEIYNKIIEEDKYSGTLELTRDDIYNGIISAIGKVPISYKYKKQISAKADEIYRDYKLFLKSQKNRNIIVSDNENNKWLKDNIKDYISVIKREILTSKGENSESSIYYDLAFKNKVTVKDFTIDDIRNNKDVLYIISDNSFLEKGDEFRLLLQEETLNALDKKKGLDNLISLKFLDWNGVLFNEDSIEEFKSELDFFSESLNDKKNKFSEIQVINTPFTSGLKAIVTADIIQDAVNDKLKGLGIDNNRKTIRKFKGDVFESLSKEQESIVNLPQNAELLLLLKDKNISEEEKDHMLKCNL
ncbi:MAG TPA: hypothetical protein PLE30_11385 [Candidatus Kapabacteria bacterium]|nr:hypothetical protein [Candidatus Kapabacteria bacterium]